MSLQHLCGCHPHGGARIDSIRAILGKEIDKYYASVVALINEGKDSEQLSLFGCFAARKMLEAGCVAVLSRIDPARFLILREFQLKTQYALEKRNSASIDWKSDVLSEKAAMWGDNVGPATFIRSLLGGHLAEVMWITAIKDLVESEEDFQDSKWLDEIFSQYEERRAQLAEKKAKSKHKKEGQPVDLAAEGKNDELEGAEVAIMSSFRTNAQQIFSKLSKGVHLEFVVDQSTRFDNVTILQTMRQSVKLVAQIAFISHFMDSATGRLNARDAFDLMLNIEKEIENGA